VVKYGLAIGKRKDGRYISSKEEGDYLSCAQFGRIEITHHHVAVKRRYCTERKRMEERLAKDQQNAFFKFRD